MNEKNLPALSEEDLIITRVFDAPREFVFKAWTEPERMMRWWGPKDFTSPYCSIDPHPGGVFHCDMRSPEGKDFWSKGIYREIVESERIVVTDSFADADGNVVPASYYGMTGDWPLELLVTVTFKDLDGKTELTIRHTGLPAGENRDMAGSGWNESFDRLAEYLAEETGKTQKAA